jgi:hypothetical protein
MIAEHPPTTQFNLMRVQVLSPLDCGNSTVLLGEDARVFVICYRITEKT